MPDQIQRFAILRVDVDHFPGQPGIAWVFGGKTNGGCLEYINTSKKFPTTKNRPRFLLEKKTKTSSKLTIRYPFGVRSLVDISFREREGCEQKTHRFTRCFILGERCGLIWVKKAV